MDGDPSFNPKEFINGAKLAYEMIVVAFADGDRKTLKNLLSREVYEGFDAAIAVDRHLRRLGNLAAVRSQQGRAAVA